MKKTFFIVLGAIILIIILVNIPNIIAHAKLYSFNHNKKVVTETKVVNPNQLLDLIAQQRNLREKIQDKTKYSLIADKMIKIEDELNDDYSYIMDEPQIKLKISVPVTTYKDNSRTIEFISGL